MAVDPAFAGAGQAEGMELWRIENKCPVKQPEVNGKLHSGDSYILLVTQRASATSAALSWNIHFWLGAETSQDELGIAAYKTVELDESLGGGPVQYREVQAHESQLFMSYFKGTGLEYLPGGVDSGFAHVERDTYRTRLLQLKGRRSVRCSEVECTSASLNTGDCFILDMGLELFLYNGATANRQEKAKSIDMINRIRNNERGGRATITVINEDPNNATFWGALGGQIEVTNAGEDDAGAEAKAAEDVKLHKVSDASGSLEVTEVAKEDGKLKRDMLDTNDVFILDAGTEIFVWVGRGCTADEKRQGMILGSDFLSQGGRPNWTPVTRCVEGAETTAFQGMFFQWNPPQLPGMFNRSGGNNQVAHVEEKRLSLDKLRTKVEAEEKSVDDGSGNLEIWRVENFEKVEWPREKYGQFYGGDSYVMLYTYRPAGKTADEYIIYFWQGRGSSQDEKGASALLAKDLDDQYQDRPVQCRVVQGKEPAHFRSLFNGRMVVHEGGAASGFKNRADTDSYDTDGVALFHVKGSNATNTCAVQVAESATSLNSGDCFVLLTPSTVYRWFGNGSNDAEKESARAVSDVIKTHDADGDGEADAARALVDVEEGSEPAEFWAAVGGQAEYPSSPPGQDMPVDPRLFQCSNATGNFDADEIPNFAQEDLIDEDVMMLDTYTQVFLWVGSQANADEKREAINMALSYVETANDGRDVESCSILRVSAGNEPPMFTQHFTGWDPELTKQNRYVDPYEARLAAMKGDNPAAAAPAPAPAAAEPMVITRASVNASGFAAAGSKSYSLDELKAGCPEGVDPTAKETYLSDADFEATFGKNKADFNAQAKWKRDAAKKAKGLF